MSEKVVIWPRVDDFHVHLRDEAMAELVAPLSFVGGAGRVLVMPNLKPPVTSVDAALAYQQRLKKIEPRLTYLMTLYLSLSLTPEELKRAKSVGIVGVKSYPRGVTTHSDSGIEDYRTYYHLFEVMQECGLILNLHGEIPSDATSNVSVWNAEELFLKHLRQLHRDFPRLRIVLEHASTKAALDAVSACGPTVSCTITLHHTELTIDDWCGQVHHFCKPVAKSPADRSALRLAVLGQIPNLKGRCFLGSDSAPHDRKLKHCVQGDVTSAPAGVFTAPVLVCALRTVARQWPERKGLDDASIDEELKAFCCQHGHQFYELPPPQGQLKMVPEKTRVLTMYGNDANGGPQVVPFLSGKTLDFTIISS